MKSMGFNSNVFNGAGVITNVGYGGTEFTSQIVTTSKFNPARFYQNNMILPLEFGLVKVDWKFKFDFLLGKSL